MMVIDSSFLSVYKLNLCTHNQSDDFRASFSVDDVRKMIIISLRSQVASLIRPGILRIMYLVYCFALLRAW